MLSTLNVKISDTKLRMKDSELQKDWQDKNILIVGAGATGLSCAHFLQRLGFKFKIIDDRQNIENLVNDFEIETGDYKQQDFERADIIIVSPGVSIKHSFIHEQIQQGKDVLGDVELFCRLTNKPVIAITGSNGKSTVTTLLGELINNAGFTAKVGGNIGIPCLDLLKQDSETDFYVLELSSFQLETTFSLKAEVSIILNLSEDHMDRYDSYSDYCLAKEKILPNAKNIIVNLDDNRVVDICNKYKANKISFSLKDNAADFYVSDEKVIHKNKAILDLKNIQLIGQHNKQNILAVIAISSSLKLNLKSLGEVIEKFPALEHRSQLVSQYNNVKWINDSKATNIGATCAALNGFSGEKIHLLLGGQAKGQNFNEIVPFLNSNIESIFVYGEDADLIIHTIQQATKAKVIKAVTLAESVNKASKLATKGDVVLLSPACASFDQFKNFVHRGEAFVEAIARLES